MLSRKAWVFLFLEAAPLELGSDARFQGAPYDPLSVHRMANRDGMTRITIAQETAF